MKQTLRTVLWFAAAGLALIGLLTMCGALNTSGTDPAGRGMNQGFGFLIALVGVAGIAALLLARFWRGFLIIAALIVALPFALVAVLTVWKGFDEKRVVREMQDMHSGRADFAEQPALLAVAEAISNNDEAAIRAAAKNVPDLQAAGREGTTLLFFAVKETLERPQLISAVETLLSLGANPNYNNGSLYSFALAKAMGGEVRLLRVMLDAGGDPNGRDHRHYPIIFDNWFMTINEAHQPARFRLLLDRGADLNSTLPEDTTSFEGYTLLLFRAHMGRGDGVGYADALELLQRGADYKRASSDGTTLTKMLKEHWEYYGTTGQTPPPEFDPLWHWLAERGAL